MADLPQHIGELTGQLKSLVPALERLDDRQSIADMKAAALEANHLSLRKEFDEVKSKNSDRLGSLFSAQHQLSVDIGQRRSEINAVSVEIAALKMKSEGLGKKAWDLALLVVAAIVGAVLTKMFGGHP